MKFQLGLKEEFGSMRGRVLGNVEEIGETIRDAVRVEACEQWCVVCVKWADVRGRVARGGV